MNYLQTGLATDSVPEDDIAVLLMADHGVELYGNAIFVSQPFAEANPDAVRGFLRAFTRGMKEAELMSVVEEGQEEGQFDQIERDMIEAVVDFRSTTVEQIMTPRTEVEALHLTNNLGEITKFIRGCRHSRIPVYEGNLDQVAGMFYIKDLMRWLAGDGPRTSGKPFELKSILRPAYFVQALNSPVRSAT